MERAAVAWWDTLSKLERGEKPWPRGEGGGGEERRGEGLEETCPSSGWWSTLWPRLGGSWGHDLRRWCAGGGDVVPRRFISSGESVGVNDSVREFFEKKEMVNAQISLNILFLNSVIKRIFFEFQYLFFQLLFLRKAETFSRVGQV